MLEKADINRVAKVERASAEKRSGGEDAQAEQEYAAPPKQIGDTSHQRHGNDIAEQVATDDPGGAVELLYADREVGDDARKSRHHDRLIERSEEHSAARCQHC